MPIVIYTDTLYYSSITIRNFYNKMRETNGLKQKQKKKIIKISYVYSYNIWVYISTVERNFRLLARMSQMVELSGLENRLFCYSCIVQSSNHLILASLLPECVIKDAPYIYVLFRTAFNIFYVIHTILNNTS